ncbi:PDZ domain-containing protein [Candidatus Gracilibacteria bacterium]|nr:PDZ domain-containing protein [Candidatus Gracilibacteria bacterium]
MFEKKNNVNNFLVIIIFLTSFITGILFNEYVDIKQGLGITKNSENKIDREIQKDLDLKLFWEAYSTIKNEYYSIEGIKKEDIVSGMISGMVNSLGDKHSEFMNLTEKKAFEETLSGDFDGIGAVVEKTDAGVVVSMVIKDSPAKNSGIIPGDLITKADGQDLKDKNLYDAVKLIKGPAGTKVKLTILRSGEFESFEKEVTRQKINIPSVQTNYFEKENIGYIAINLFGDKTSEEFKEALKEVNDKKISGLIIDLRDNGGGYLQSAVEILSEFIENGNVLVKTKYRDSLFNNEYKSINTGEIFNKKIVILVNGNSASASEITAGALREYNKAIIVGEKTFGKGSVQEPFDLSNGGLLKITIAKWFTPKGKNIDQEGIEPDIEVVFIKEDYEKLYDRQLEEAKKILKSFTKYEALQLSVDKYKEENKSK